MIRIDAFSGPGVLTKSHLGRASGPDAPIAPATPGSGPRVISQTAGPADSTRPAFLQQLKFGPKMEDEL